MKADIHPNYKKVDVLCSCGNSFATKSTYHGETLRIEVCSECHPFYTGKHKIMDTEGRVDQFMRRYAAKAVAAPAVEKTAVKAKAKPKTKAKEDTKKSK